MMCCLSRFFWWGGGWFVWLSFSFLVFTWISWRLYLFHISWAQDVTINRATNVLGNWRYSPVDLYVIDINWVLFQFVLGIVILQFFAWLAIWPLHWGLVLDLSGTTISIVILHILCSPPRHKQPKGTAKSNSTFALVSFPVFKANVVDFTLIKKLTENILQRIEIIYVTFPLFR
jgi:hypothetical protein